MERETLRLRLDRRAQEVRDLSSAGSGDRAAFGRLVEMHFGGIYGLLFRMVGNPEDAEDLAQEVFVRAWKSLGSISDDEALRPWLTRIAVNLFYDHLRKRGRGLRVVELDPLAADPGGREMEPFEELDNREAQALLGAAIERLPERLQAAVILRVVEGRSYEETAAAMGLKQQTVRGHVAKGRQLLMRFLKPWLTNGGSSL
ncbi:MAG: sigma-70 family RNA polymerase sigma factor [Planctomycetota bacterium]|nr:sigma-70 family RNA polymerase sigma factor [Planctomycetota bacterium]